MKYIKYILPVLALFILTSCIADKTGTTTTETSTTTETTTTDTTATDTTTSTDTEEEADFVGEVKFIITGKNFAFVMDGKENPDLRVKKGNKVRIEFSSTEGFHDWVVDEFNAATRRVNENDPVSVEFIADKNGTFAYYCSVGSHRANGMEGKLIVE